MYTLKGFLDYAILRAISELRSKNCTESCKQEQQSQPEDGGFLLRATFSPSACSTFVNSTN